jgi:hypothetical protein
LLTLSAWGRVLPRETVFVGATAAWLHGLDLEPTNPVEIALPASYGVRSRAGLIVRRLEIPPAEVVSLQRLRATAIAVTLAGLCLQRPPIEALIAIDMAVRLRLIDSPALGQYAEVAKGRPGTARLRALAVLAAPAGSPMETRLRWLLIQAGLPTPDVQSELRDSANRLIGRVDLYYPSARLALEYDGINHRERLVDDNRRQNRLLNAGYRLLRFTAPDIHNPDVVVAQVRAALRATSE